MKVNPIFPTKLARAVFGLHLAICALGFSLFLPTWTLAVDVMKQAELSSLYEAIYAPICSIRNFDAKVSLSSVVLPTEPSDLTRVQVIEQRDERRVIHDLTSKKSFVLRRLTAESEIANQGGTLDYRFGFFENGEVTYRASRNFYEISTLSEGTFESFRSQVQLGLPQFMVTEFKPYGPYYEPREFEATVGTKFSKGMSIRQLPDGTWKVAREHPKEDSTTVFSQTLDSKEFRILASSLVLERNGISIPSHRREFEYTDEKFPYLPTKIRFKSRERLKVLGDPDGKRVEAEESGTIDIFWYRVNDAPGFDFPDLKALSLDLKNWEKVLTTGDLLKTKP